MRMAGSGGDELPANIGDDMTLACRIGAELGAEVITTRYSGNMDGFRMHEVLQAGVSGVILARQIWQHGNSAAAVGASRSSSTGARESARPWLPSSNDGAPRGAFHS